MANTQYPIGSSKEYIRGVKGLYGRSIGTRNEMLFNNPLVRRYREHAEGYSMVDAPEIGEPYILPNPKSRDKKFWDSFGGLVGYTYDQGYIETDNYKVISRFEDIEKHQGYLRDRVPYLYNVDIPVDINREFFDYSFLNRLYGYSMPFREINLYGNSESYGEFNPVRHTTNRYNPEEGMSYVEPKSENVIYSTNEETFYVDGKSIDTTSYSRDDLGYLKTLPSNQSLNDRIHGLYDERTEGDDKNRLNRGNGTENDNRPSNDLIYDLADFNNDGNGLISKTNELFRQGKINSMINRFYLPNQERSEIQTALHGKYGVSRGRNLTRKNSTITSNGYEDPYCRVWTSHYQYSKYKNAIRPFIEDGMVLSPPSFDDKFGIGFRPFKTNRTMSTIDEGNGLPIIAPMKKDGEYNENDIRRCMFSIENLAWKDVHVDTRVHERGFDSLYRGYDNVLSKEQMGPNGGRIMWFPPYNLKFTENVGVNWNGNSFIGRGEQIYTYVNTDRTGTLDFTLLIDHPSILDRYTVNKGEATIENDEDILRFFAGCGMLEIDDKMTETKTKTRPLPPVVEDEPPVDPVPDEIIADVHKRLYAFFPNNFSGEDHQDNPVKAINYLLLGGTGATGYEGGMTQSNSPINGCLDEATKTCKNKNGKINTWYYESDDWKKNEVLKVNTTYKKGAYGTNYKDSSCFGLNDNRLISILTGNTADSKKAKEYLRLNDLSDEEITQQVVPFSSIDMLRGEFEIHTSDDQAINALDQAESIRIRCVGFASKHGNQIPKGNERLAFNRAEILRNYLIKESKFDPNWFEPSTVEGYNMEVGNDSVSSIEAKLGRHAAVFIDITYKYTVEPTVEKTEEENAVIINNNVDKLLRETTLDLYNKGAFDGIGGYNKLDTSTIDKSARDAFLAKPVEPIKSEFVTTEEIVREPEYDTEYRYFERIDKEQDVVKRLITDKVKYFDPAYHSITPEGFNARLTFLHQCTRQGPTVAASENGAVSAGNLAFGRPPVCVLRIGDFYNTKIIIDSVSINYDANGGTQWDMNTEGIGLQPMFANVTIGFKFLGGSDLSGPIARLQNAVSYNFYANTSVYDRHADYRNAFVTDNANVDLVNMWEAGVNTKTNDTANKLDARLQKIYNSLGGESMSAFNRQRWNAVLDSIKNN